MRMIWGMNDGQCLTIKEVFWTCSHINQYHKILKLILLAIIVYQNYTCHIIYLYEFLKK